MKVKSESEVAQSCLTLCDPMDCSLPGSSVHGIFQARVLEWGAIAFSILLLGIDQKEIIVGNPGGSGEGDGTPHSSTLAWKIPWTEEPGGLQSMGSLGVGHD